MIIQDIRVRTAKQPHEETPAGAAGQPCTDICGFVRSPILVDALVNAKEGVYDRVVANDLGFASAWAYSDLGTFARAMCCHVGLELDEFVAVSDENPALTVDNTAYLAQSSDRKLVILAFRGTGPTNISNWLSDVSAHTELFYTEGRVHTGFLLSALVLWRPVAALLVSALKGRSICDESAELRSGFRSCAEQALPCGLREQAPTMGDPDVLRTLYITGHSMGGALAVLTAALIHADPALAALQKTLRGVYTFGQPMVGEADFTHGANKKFGDRLFRHVYRNDVVPRLPPFTSGRYRHFGEEYRSTEQGWVYSAEPVRQAFTGLVSLAIGVVAWITRELSGIPLAWLPLPFSFADHSPLNYLRMCQMVSPGYEFL